MKVSLQNRLPRNLMIDTSPSPTGHDRCWLFIKSITFPYRWSFQLIANSINTDSWYILYRFSDRRSQAEKLGCQIRNSHISRLWFFYHCFFGILWAFEMFPACNFRIDRLWNIDYPDVDKDQTLIFPRYHFYKFSNILVSRNMIFEFISYYIEISWWIFQINLYRLITSGDLIIIVLHTLCRHHDQPQNLYLSILWSLSLIPWYCYPYSCSRPARSRKFIRARLKRFFHRCRWEMWLYIVWIIRQ